MKKLSLSLLSVIACISTVEAQVKVTATGIIGIGTETPAHPLDIRRSRTNFSESDAPFRIEVANSDPRLTSTSKIVFYNTSHTGPIPIEASAFNTISDERMKTNIQSLSKRDPDASPLQKILQLNGYTYQWKHEAALRKAGGTDSQKQTGFLAQEVEKLFPEAVTTSHDSTGMKAVTYHQIIPYLVEAIKEQQLMINALKNELSIRTGHKSTGVIEPKNQTAILPHSEKK